MKKLLFIINPISGKKKVNRIVTDIVGIFNRAQWDVTVYVTAARGDATELVARRSGEFDMIVCAGGDGTFNEMVSGHRAADAKCPLGYIPTGSTNDFANSLHLSKTPLQAARDLANGTAVPLDLGRCNDRYFSYIASFGAFTRASYATSQGLKNTLGHFAYILSGIKEIAAIHGTRMRFTLPDGTVLEDDYIFGAVSNTTSVAGILTLDPKLVDMSDGKFELLLIRKPRTALELSECVLALTSQKYDTPMLTLRSVQRVEMDCDEVIPWSLDGEEYTGANHCVVENLHHEISLVMDHKK